MASCLGVGNGFAPPRIAPSAENSAMSQTGPSDLPTYGTQQEYVVKLEAILDDEISWEVEWYKTASLGKFHSVLFGLFILFAQQLLNILFSLKGLLIHDLGALVEAVMIIVFSVTFFCSALFNGLRLQLTKEVFDTPAKRRSRDLNKGFRTDVLSYFDADLFKFGIVPPSGQAGLWRLWLTLRATEEKLQILARYRDINRKRSRAHELSTGLLLLATVMAGLGASLLFDVHQTLLSHVHQ